MKESVLNEIPSWFLRKAFIIAFFSPPQNFDSFIRQRKLKHLSWCWSLLLEFECESSWLWFLLNHFSGLGGTCLEFFLFVSHHKWMTKWWIRKRRLAWAINGCADCDYELTSFWEWIDKVTISHFLRKTKSVLWFSCKDHHPDRLLLFFFFWWWSSRSPWADFMTSWIRNECWWRRRGG